VKTEYVYYCPKYDRIFLFDVFCNSNLFTFSTDNKVWVAPAFYIGEL